MFILKEFLHVPLQVAIGLHYMYREGNICLRFFISEVIVSIVQF